MLGSRQEETTSVNARHKSAVTPKLESQLLATICHFPCCTVERKQLPFHCNNKIGKTKNQIAAFPHPNEIIEEKKELAFA
jgi:hypothetical protein